jgi:GntR family transcriptional regulator
MKLNIDRSSQVPLHAQIYEKLRRQIENSKLKAGFPVPSERELSELCGVSRMTARQALTALRNEGLIYLERGVGTFVAKRKLDVHTRNLIGFTEEMRLRGLKPSSKLLLSRQEQATSSVAQELTIDVDDDVFHFQRLRLADGSPLAFEDAYLPLDRFPDLAAKDLEKSSLYEILSDTYGVEMHHAEEILEAVAAPKDIAGHLTVKPGSPLLLVHRVVFTETNIAVESVRTYYRADQYRATFMITKNGSISK